MNAPSRRRFLTAIFSLFAITIASSGCSKSQADKPRVQVLIGGENYTKAAPQLAVGKTAKFKGAIGMAGSKGNLVQIHMGDVYTGDLPAVKSVDLSKEFLTDRAAVDKKYKPDDEIVVAGQVIELQPDHYTVVLEGYTGTNP